jgi:hypothetical protein
MASEPCCGRPARARRPLRGAAWLALAPGFALLAAPKCPLCVLAYLSLFGASVTAAVTAYPLVPIALGLSAVALGALVARRRGFVARSG